MKWTNLSVVDSLELIKKSFRYSEGLARDLRGAFVGSSCHSKASRW